MNIEDYILELMEVVDKLKSHPNIHLVNFNVVEQNDPNKIHMAIARKTWVLF